MDLSDFTGKIKGFDKILSEIEFPAFNITMVYRLLYIQRLALKQGQVQILEFLMSNKLSLANYKTSSAIYLSSLHFCFLTHINEFITNYIPV